MQSRRVPTKKRPVRSRAHRTVVRWLIFCFPAGLLMMWSDRCKWSRAVKSAISMGFALLLIALVLPQTQPPERVTSGVQMVGLKPSIEVYGPEPDDSLPEIQIYNPLREDAVRLITPAPTPEPIMVYCNDSGRFYHTQECRYVKKRTPDVTLSQALDAGYKPCEKCNPPTEEDERNR